MIPALLSEQEAAAVLRMSQRTLRSLRDNGKIRYIRTSRRKIHYTPEDIADYIARQARQEDAPCPSIAPRKARASTMTSSGAAPDILDRLAARPGGMPKGMKLIYGGKSR